MNKPRIPVRHLPNNSSSLATDPRSIAIAQNNARIRFYAGLPDEDEEIPNQGASERMAAAAREDV